MVVYMVCPPTPYVRTYDVMNQWHEGIFRYVLDTATTDSSLSNKSYDSNKCK